MTTQHDENSRTTQASVQQTWKTTRKWAMGVKCPQCQAWPHSKCFNRDGGLRASCHQERHDAAIRQGAPASLHGRP